MNIYKNIPLKMVAILCMLLFSCDEGFEDMNTNPNAYVDPNINSMFAFNLIESARGHGRGLHANKTYGGYLQYFESLNAWQWPGGKYIYRPLYKQSLWPDTYSRAGKDNGIIIYITRDNPDRVNHHYIARIWRVWLMHIITDIHGDVPYFEAMRGLEEILKPGYDRQEDIYADMLKELEDAANALDSSLPSYGASDYIYGGNVEKWRRFAYSMMLRLGMRLTEVDPAMAETWVKKAIAGGVMESNEDIAIHPHSDGGALNYNWSANWMWGGEGVPPAAEGKGYGKMGETFVSHLVNTSDPRIPFYITMWQGNANPDLLPVYTDQALQQGLPHGYDYSNITDIIPDWTDEKYADYSEINLHTISSRSAPYVYQTYAEVKLYLAEAALRGWVTGDAKTHYEDAVRASMQIPLLFPGDFSISDAEVNAYLENNPYVDGSFEQQMEQIHTQLWVSLFMSQSNFEQYSNWRRTGYPVLIPTDYPGNVTGGQIPRRLRYPASEADFNADNYNEAVQRQGPDEPMTRVWWDVN